MKGIKYLLYSAERPDASLLQRLLGNGKSGSAAIHYFVSGMKFGYGIYYVSDKKIYGYIIFYLVVMYCLLLLAFLYSAR